MSILKNLLIKFLFFPLFLVGFNLQSAENPTLQVPQSSLNEEDLAIENKDEIKILEQLIQTTEKQLEMQKRLKTLMVEFKNQQEQFVQGDQTKAHASQMVRTARQIYELIAINHIDYLFPKSYLEELAFFSSIAGKNKISKP